MNNTNRIKRCKLISPLGSLEDINIPNNKEIIIKVEPNENSIEIEYDQLLSLTECGSETIKQEDTFNQSTDKDILTVHTSDAPSEEIEQSIASQNQITHLITNAEDDDYTDEEDCWMFAGENFGKFCCIECRMNFASQDILESHMLSTHLEETSTQIKCLICGFEKGSRKGLRMHFHQHTTFRPYKCFICNMRFLRAATLRFHHRTHEKKPKMDQTISRIIMQSNLEFFQSLRVSKKLFAFLLRKIEEDAVIRRPKVVDERTYKRPMTPAGALIMALSYIGRRLCFEELAESFGSCESSCHRIVWLIIYYFAELSKKYIRWRSFRFLKQEEKKFKELYEFPGIVGAIGTCPINIRTPENLDREKFSHWSCPTNVSIQLMAICDSKGKFMFVATGNPGSLSEELVLSLTPFGKKIDSDPLSLFHTSEFHLVGNDTYALRKNLLVPMRGNDLTPSEVAFTKKLNEAKAVIEKSFYYLKGRFLRLALIENSIENINALIMACCVIHNLALHSEEDMEYLIEDLDEFIPSTLMSPSTNFEIDAEAVAKRDKIILTLL